jgi:hypothetical protein
MNRAPAEIKKTPAALKRYLIVLSESLSNTGFPKMKITAVKLRYIQALPAVKSV